MENRLKIIKSLNKKAMLAILESNLSLDELNKLIMFKDKVKLIKNMNAIYSNSEIIDIIYTSQIPTETIFKKMIDKFKTTDIITENVNESIDFIENIKKTSIE